MRTNSACTLLGFSPGAIAMFSEIIYSETQGALIEAQIIHNNPIPNLEEIPYKLDGCKYVHLDHTDWKPSVTELISFGVNKSSTKQQVYEHFKGSHGLEMSHFRTWIHTNSSISNSARVGQGIFINPGVVVAPYANLHNGVTVNRNASIGHHTEIGLFSTIHPGVNIAGHVSIGVGCTIGIGANVVDGVTIGNGTTIGAGSLVTKDIPENSIAYGSPARIVKSV